MGLGNLADPVCKPLHIGSQCFGKGRAGILAALSPHRFRTDQAPAMSKENPHKCPRCDTLINELPATCRACGTRLKRPPPRPERPASGPIRGKMLGPIFAVISMIGWAGYLVFAEGPFKIVS